VCNVPGYLGDLCALLMGVFALWVTGYLHGYFSSLEQLLLLGHVTFDLKGCRFHSLHVSRFICLGFDRERLDKFLTHHLECSRFL
jgi:hypothetical protein